MYEVIRYFTDLQDNNYEYNVGDVFPHVGLAVTDERYAELASYNNKQNHPLIKKVADVVDEDKPKRRGRKPQQ